MTDLRSLTILGLMGRLLPEIDRGDIVPPADIQDAIARGTILELLKNRYGDYPKFSPIHQAEAALLRKELRDAMEAIGGREECLRQILVARNLLSVCYSPDGEG